MMSDSFRAGWVAQIFFYFAAYNFVRAFEEVMQLFSASTITVAGGLLAIAVVLLAISRYWAIVIAAFGAGYMVFRSFIDAGETALSMTPEQAAQLIGLLSLTGVTSIGIGRWIRGRDLKSGDKFRSRAAKASLEQAYAAADGKISLRNALYLRPFVATDQFRVRNPLQKTVGTPEFFELDFELDIERVFAETFADTTPMIALGLPGEHLGAGRIETDDDGWQDYVRRLADAAEFIIMLPSHRAGTQWEIKHILDENLLTKSVWIMPPSTSRNRSDSRAYWLAAQEKTREACGLNLPAYDDHGMVFSYDERLQVRNAEPLDLSSQSSLQQSVRRVLSITQSSVERPKMLIEVEQRPWFTPAINYLFIAVGFVILTSVIASINAEQRYERFAFDDDFEDTLSAGLNVLDDNNGIGRLSNSQGGEPPTDSAPLLELADESNDAGDDQESSAVDSNFVFGPLGDNSATLPKGWTQKKLGGANSTTLFSEDRKVTCHASVAPYEEESFELFFVQAHLSEEQGLRRSKNFALRQLQTEGLESRVSVRTKVHDNDGILPSYIVIGEIEMADVSLNTRARVFMDGKRMIRVDCGGPARAVSAIEDEINVLLESVVPGSDEFTRAERLNIDVIDYAIAMSKYFQEEVGDTRRAFDSADAGIAYFFDVSQKDENGVPVFEGVELSSKLALMFNLRGSSSEALGRQVAAMSDYERALDIWKPHYDLSDPHLRDLQSHLADLYVESGRFSDAEALRSELNDSVK